MTSTVRFMLSPKFINAILDNSFGMPNDDYSNTSIYVGLGIEFNQKTFEFTKEPLGKWATILRKPLEFSEPINGIIRNEIALYWPKAKEDWTLGEDEIQYIGLYYKTYELSDSEVQEDIKGDTHFYEVEDNSVILQESLENKKLDYSDPYSDILENNINGNYELIAVLPLMPPEQIKQGDMMVLNANMIQLSLKNR